MEIYIVRPNDTIDRIAGVYGVTAEQVSYANQIPYPYRLAVGQALLIPAGESTENRRVATANGYAYPFISPWVLQQTLPYLSNLLVFSYGYTTGGELIPPLLPDEWMVEEAIKNSHPDALRGGWKI